MTKLTHRQKQNQKWLDYIKPKFYKHLCKNVFKIKFWEAQPNYKKLANEYITRRKEEGKSITIIFLVTLLYQ
jgi:hypothetical protein